MRTGIAAIVFCIVVTAAVGGAVWAEKPPEEGTSAEELGKMTLPLPQDTKVVVIPMWDYTSNVHHLRVAVAAIHMHLEREGLKMVPILDGFKALSADKEIEPGLPLRKADAVRIGKAVDADWAVYGEVKELRVYQKAKFFGPEKKIICSMRLAVADCRTAECFYWKARQDTLGDSGIVVRKSTTLIRVGLQTVTENIIKPLLAALPKHEVKGDKPDDAALLEFEKKVWPEGGD